MSYGLLAYSLITPKVKVELHLKMVIKSAQIVINSGVKKSIKIDNIEKIECSFSEFLITQNNEKFIKLTKDESLLVFMNI